VNKRVTGTPILACLFFVLVFTTAGCRSRSDAKHSENVMENSKPIHYLAIGDSTGVGVGAQQGGGYVARLFERIKHERPGSTLTNLCVSGATTSDLIELQLQRAIDERPDLVTVGIGINDITRMLPPDRFSQNYEEIVSRLKNETDARIVVSNLPDISYAPAIPISLRPQLQTQLVEYNRRIEEIAQRHEVHLADSYTPTHDLLPSHPEFFSEDGFHPSEIGYEYWAKTLWPVVRDSIKE
jgi:acyl-CoA thioesterase-1